MTSFLDYKKKMTDFWKSKHNIEKRHAGMFSSTLAMAVIFYEKLSENSMKD